MIKKQRGVTLIELMISLVLSLALIGGISSLFQQMQTTNKSQLALSNIMDDSRYALEIMQKEIRYAGGLRSRSSITGTGALVFAPLTAAKQGVFAQLGYNTTPLPAGPAGIFGFIAGEYVQGNLTSPRPASDSFMIRYQLMDQNDLNPNNPSNSSSPCTSNSLLTLPADDPATQVHVVTVYFYVNSGVLSCTSQRVRVDDVNTGATTCMTNCALGDAPAQLISNVNRLVVTYGVDTGTDRSANFYADALNVPNWLNVVSMRVSLVLQSADDDIVRVKAPYMVDRISFTPSDNRLYRVFSTTIALRNQI